MNRGGSSGRMHQDKWNQCVFLRMCQKRAQKLSQLYLHTCEAVFELFWGVASVDEDERQRAAAQIQICARRSGRSAE